MLLDYLFYRYFKAYCKYWREGDPFLRSKGCLLATLQIVIVPLSINVPLLFDSEASVSMIFFYVMLNLCGYVYIRNRYTHDKLREIVAKYKKSVYRKFPMFIIWIFVAFSMSLGLILMIILSLFMKAYGLIGYFE